MKRKKYSDPFKAQVVKDVKETGNKSLVARRYDIHVNLVNRWVKDDEAGKFAHINPEHIDAGESKVLVQENDQLKKLLGEKDLEIAILRDLIKKQNPHLLTKLK